MTDDLTDDQIAILRAVAGAIRDTSREIVDAIDEVQRVAPGWIESFSFKAGENNRNEPPSPEAAAAWDRVRAALGKRDEARWNGGLIANEAGLFDDGDEIDLMEFLDPDVTADEFRLFAGNAYIYKPVDVYGDEYGDDEPL